ncbi:organic hydroperoxide resistance protein [Mesorhizobium sp. M4B.F.Ca.ET.215.01.1.1]|uniref:organic hydroperoxide resistance protein n=1 Tax=unclassified Mesorhizobium TaxID=325217 RepID=UPI000FCC1605|nr:MULTISPECIES: organic hydroperoxide resistance protein [unclassified Mesorhizobium]RUW28278.1 organic hydroperoxide resistance protein [Mesorhizobium sp. M4B.F.Ca.ET.013.02.1.1]RUW76855.1 organic hydroperoxide resistance protein [Mesorhizobium sp. M4B.F.Ca.ET.049.02.1.2]RVD33534.1 organic hydroperoxide resistance protein [Mesorhizobium sp. M4B.F.Ca.ET.019.03.1.1]RWC88733.1 MAG: organic hydroperoxide resistance protein [Mesorhizobium sp.]RWF64509.1 MAG: organic hydroperoxide resistance prote
MSALYTTQARVSGGRAGHAETSDGLLKVDLAMPKELGGQGGATNPEQLFAAGYAACFESAIRFVARKEKLPLEDAAVTASVSLHPNGQGGFRLGVSLAAETKGLDHTAAEALVSAAHQICPYSNAIRGNIDVALSTVALPAKAA